MNRNSRRRLLRASGLAAFASLSGCLWESDRSTTDSPTRERSFEDGTTGSSTEDLSPEELLPREGDGWSGEQVDRGFAWSARGAEDGVFGRYTSPEDRSYEVVIMEVGREYDPETKATNWACTVGWNVALTYRQFAVAAGTGTRNRTFTPERPPHMTRTPIPGTTEPTRELLSRSPVLSRAFVDRHAITDC